MTTGRYVQGPGALDRVGAEAAVLGKRAALICDADVLPLVEERMRASLHAEGSTVTVVPFRGTVTHPAIEALAEVARGADVVLGAGGGRAVDAAKGVARRLATPIVSVPTAASTDAPASRGIAVYDDDHRVVAVEQLPRNPDCVLVDTALIARAPAHLLSAGIGDAVTKTFEAQACWAVQANTKHGTPPLRAAGAVAEACYRAVRRHGVRAVEAVRRGEVDEDLEATVEAVLLLSAMGFENGGLSVAHAVAPGLARLRGASEATHGAHAAYGTLVQLAFEDRPEPEVEDLMGFLHAVGLPLSLAGLGAPGPSNDEIDALAEACMENPHARNQLREVNAAGIAAAIRTVERRAAAFGQTPARG